jgi:DNA-binding MarR family transcriptional regulator
MKYSFDKSLGRITHQVSKRLGEKLSQKFRENQLNMDPFQWTVLSYLNYNEESIQKDIADFLGVNKVRTMRILDSLEKEGMIKRNIARGDKRQNNVKLTEKGKSYYDKLSPLAEETLKEAYSNLSQKEIQQCINTLLKIQDNL